MIIDVHSHAWKFPGDFTEDFSRQARRARAGMEVDLTVRYEDYRAAAPADTKAIVFGGKAKLSGTWVDDRYVADYVAAHPDTLIGFLCVDPTQEGWQREMEFGHQELGLRGIKLLPMYAGFRPDDASLEPLWRYVSKNQLPVLLHTGTTFISQAPLECTLPRHLDAVAIRHPDVKIIMAHLGHPYEGECIVTIRKHPNVYADISALHYRPFQLYHSLMLTQEYGVWHKLLFGTDYPFTTVNATIDGLRNLNKMTEGTGLPKLNEKAIEEMIHRDTLTLLGLQEIMDRSMNQERVAVIGLGLLGRGIAACFLGHGFHVVAVDRSEEQHAEARKQLAVMMGELVDLGGFPPQLRDEWTTRYTAATNFDAVKDCTFIVESVTEDVATKEAVFDALESLLSPAIVIATNTSAIPISQLQQRRQVPARFVGMHWAEPAHATRFMELIRGSQTSDETLQTAADMARRLGKEPCICQKDVPGFIVNRIGYAMYREALNVLQSGVADAASIDGAMRNALGLWATVCGPLRWIDITGGPEAYARAMQHVLPSLSNSTELPAVIQKLATEGARGITNGRGFYNYTKSEAEHWEELYRKHAWRVAKMHHEYFPLNQNKMSDREKKLEALGYPLSKRTPEGSLVDPLAIAGNMLYASGQVPFDGETLTSKGKVPSQVSVEDATRATALCAANVLRAVYAHVGSLDKIQRVVRITGYVNADADFTDCHLVINGASRLVREVFGEEGRHARTALAMAQLPLGASVEVEMIFQLKS